ncbi:RidA family protein [Calycomorphotria hydatis]|uniref:Putative endoribonuclease L-PSP n=1 Tax=Calycomorphotria hydatis TaxID=2528027 RepID=A0A517TDL5_9PLAN|nr:RidA family protein [Calycomorphotria hydatis]QDT66459.1 putative endoribonuclease L-PSP [Calycomorphotria hydatis]
MSIDAKLAELEIELPEAPEPAGVYVPVVQVGNMLYTAGHIPNVKGTVGDTVDQTLAHHAAAQVARLMLATLKKHLGSLDRVERLIKTTGFVNCTPDFTEHPFVINGFSQTMINVFGEKAKGARSAVGAPSLPLDVCVEVEAIWEVGE